MKQPMGMTTARKKYTFLDSENAAKQKHTSKECNGKTVVYLTFI